MSEFLAAMVMFPTIVFTALLGVVAVYWTMVLIGALDVAKDADVDMGKDLDLGKDVDLGKDIDFGKDADLGDVDGGGDADADADGDSEGESKGGGFVGLLKSLGLSGVPLTVALSVLILYSWAASMLLTGPLSAQLAGKGMLLTAGLVGIGVLAFVLAVPVASLTIRPLRPLFVVVEAPRPHHFVGRPCRIVSQTVDGDFGRAEIGQGASLLLVDVRCDKPNSLTRGDTAVVYDYDAQRKLFLVAENKEL